MSEYSLRTTALARERLPAQAFDEDKNWKYAHYQCHNCAIIVSFFITTPTGIIITMPELTVMITYGSLRLRLKLVEVATHKYFNE